MRLFVQCLQVIGGQTKSTKNVKMRFQISKMLMLGEAKTAKTILKGLQQTVTVITKIQKSDEFNPEKREEW